MSEQNEIREYKIGDKVVSLGGGNFVVITAQTMNQMQETAQRMGDMILQLGTMVSTVQKRMDELEARQRRVTISHGDVKRIQQLIRIRAGEICGKYQLAAEDGKAFRAAIRRDVLKRWGVKDLHDIPEAALGAVESAIGSWVNIRMVMERRNTHE